MLKLILYLSCPFDTLPDAEVTENPCDAEGDDKLESQPVRVVNLNNTTMSNKAMVLQDMTELQSITLVLKDIKILGPGQFYYIAFFCAYFHAFSLIFLAPADSECSSPVGQSLSLS